MNFRSNQDCSNIRGRESGRSNRDRDAHHKGCVDTLEHRNVKYITEEQPYKSSLWFTCYIHI